MKTKELKELIETGREIEFTYKKRNYSITYYNDDRINYISFCEFNGENIDVNNFDTLCDIKVYNIRLIEILNSISDDDITIY